MAVTFDPDKNARNIAERGLPFERVADLDRDSAVIVVDARRAAKICGSSVSAGQNRREVRLYDKKDHG